MLWKCRKYYIIEDLVEENETCRKYKTRLKAMKINVIMYM